MQKRYNIKWRDTDEKALAKAVRKFNAKRTRLLKQVPELEEFLPAKLSTKELKKTIKTRRDFNNEINSIERFMQKGAEKPIVTKEGVKTIYRNGKGVIIIIKRILQHMTKPLPKSGCNIIRKKPIPITISGFKQ